VKSITLVNHLPTSKDPACRTLDVPLLHVLPQCNPFFKQFNRAKFAFKDEGPDLTALMQTEASIRITGAGPGEGEVALFFIYASRNDFVGGQLADFYRRLGGKKSSRPTESLTHVFVPALYLRNVRALPLFPELLLGKCRFYAYEFKNGHTIMEEVYKEGGIVTLTQNLIVSLDRNRFEKLKSIDRHPKWRIYLPAHILDGLRLNAECADMYSFFAGKTNNFASGNTIAEYMHSLEVMLCRKYRHFYILDQVTVSDYVLSLNDFFKTHSFSLYN